MNQTDWAYLAGIMDGEGYLTVNKSGVRIEISSTDINLIDWLSHKLGGSRTQHQPKNLHYKLTYKWFCAARDDVKHVLVNTVRTMIIKQPQALMILQYLEVCPIRVTDPDTMKLRQRYIDRLTIMNKRGVD